jgi:hypothetical protein
MLTVFTQLQYRNVAIPSEALAFQNIHATVTRVIGNIMNLKG